MHYKRVLKDGQLFPQAIKSQRPQGLSVQKKVKLIVSDVDGTLLNSKQELTSGVLSAVTKAAAAGVPVGKLLTGLHKTQSYGLLHSFTPESRNTSKTKWIQFV